MHDAFQSRLRRIFDWVAAQLADTRPLRRVPGWWSGLASQQPSDFNRQLRAKFWRALAGDSIRIPWYNDLKLEVMLGNDLSFCLYVDGEIDPNEFSFLALTLKPGMTVIDAGANEGIYSVFCRSRVGHAGRVIAIEPSARECKRIERNRLLNGMEDIEILPMALSEHAGDVSLHVAQDGHAGHNTLGHSFAAGWVYAQRDEIVPAATLDSIVEQQRIDKLDLIKLDVEGSELAALRGAERTLQRDHPALLMEVMEESLTTQDASARQLLDHVRQLGYTIYEFSAATGLPVPLTTPDRQLVNIIALHPAGSIGPLAVQTNAPG